MADDVVEFVPKPFFKRDYRPPYRHHKHNDGNNAFDDFQFFFE